MDPLPDLPPLKGTVLVGNASNVKRKEGEREAHAVLLLSTAFTSPCALLPRSLWLHCCRPDLASGTVDSEGRSH